jgi:uncharacterized protein (DUF1697 family)
MSVFISMLRGINVGAQKRLQMETLRGIYTQLGFTHVKTYVQSGNLVCEGPEQDPASLTRMIETQIEQTCGYRAEVFIRQPGEIQRILAGNPFLKDRDEEPSKLHVSFFYRVPSETGLSKLIAPDGISDEFVLGEMAVYLFCPNGYGKSKLTNRFFERKLGMPVTTRNWNTVNALYKMASEEQVIH